MPPIPIYHTRDAAMKKIASVLPKWARPPLRRAREFLRTAPYYGTARWCPVCGLPSRRFRTYGRELREDVMCIHCGALERHRFVWLYLNRMTDIFDGRTKSILHVAPEPCFENRLKKRLGDSYVTADLTSPRAMVKMDITDIQYPDESFDVIYCSHVLEHIQDDKRAMREVYRILKRRGWAIMLVPITADSTFEDPSIVNPHERLKAFGQENHVRRYGPDYVDRLREAGFKVTITRVPDIFEKDDVIRMGLSPASGEIYYCTK
jgi:SAM-dependent methyltransferase